MDVTNARYNELLDEYDRLHRVRAGIDEQIWSVQNELNRRNEMRKKIELEGGLRK